MRDPLEKLRVLERATGIAGPYAGRLFAMLGATVVKCEPAQGDPVRAQPVDAAAVADGEAGALHIHLNAGKRLVTRDAVPLERALAWADVVIESAVARELRGTPLDPAALAADADAPLLVTTSAWGFEADDPGRLSDELLVQAAAGVMCTTGDPDGPPLRLPGFQAQYMAGSYVAAAALAALRGPGWHHVDVPWVHAIASGVEASWARNLQAGLRDAPGGAHQLDVFPSGALPCADGFVVPGTVRPADWVAQCRVYGMPELLEDERFRSRGRRRRNHEELWSELEPWYGARTRSEIFEASLEGNWALGMVLAGRDLLDDPHLAARSYLGPVALPKGARVRAPVRPWKAPGTGARETRLAERGEDDPWFAGAALPRARAEAKRRALQDVRVLELTQAWAGPFVGRLLGALGADVVKVESAKRPDGWRGPSAFGDMAPHLGRDPKELSVEISTAYNGLNRNKRHCSIDLTAEGGRDIFLELVRVADVVVANLTARVLPNLRLGFDDLSAVNPRIILVNMPALGATGPYRDAVGYGTIVEGMGGLASLFGPPEAGARISQTYYPDPVAGLHASVAVLSMLERRETTGTGGEIDLSHQEVLWLQLGEVIVEASRGRDVARIGNRVPGAATSGVWPVRDRRWVAVSGDASCGDLLESSHTRSADELVAALRERGARATEVMHFAEARGTPPMADAIESVIHPVTEACDYLRVPLRIDGHPVDTRVPAPTFDQHTLQVLSEWIGRGADDLAPLVESGAVGGAPDPRGLREFYLNRSRR